MLDAETPLSTYFPQNYTLAGVYLRVGVFFNIGDGPLSIGLVPEIGSASSLSSQLNGQAQVEHGFLVGAEAHVVLEVIPELVVTLLYREAHAFLGSALGSEMNDAERYAILRAEYRF